MFCLFLYSYTQVDLSLTLSRETLLQYIQKQTSQLQEKNIINDNFWETVFTSIEGKQVAIFLDDFPVTMPTVNEPILNGTAQISGSFTVESAVFKIIVVHIPQSNAAT